MHIFKFVLLLQYSLQYKLQFCEYSAGALPTSPTKESGSSITFWIAIQLSSRTK